MTNPTIVIADDHKLMSEGLTGIIHSNTTYRVTHSVNDGKELLHLLNHITPTLILLDINMPKIDGIEAAKEIKARFPQILIICVSMYQDKNLYTTLKQAGADGFIPKLSDTEVFLDTIHRVISGEKLFLSISPDEDKSKQSETIDPFNLKVKLSNRELEIMRLIKQGLTSKEISDKVHLSTFTVDTHRKNICRKLNITSPNALVKYLMNIDF